MKNPHEYHRRFVVVIMQASCTASHVLLLLRITITLFLFRYTSLLTSAVSSSKWNGFIPAFQIAQVPFCLSTWSPHPLLFPRFLLLFHNGMSMPARAPDRRCHSCVRVRPSPHPRLGCLPPPRHGGSRAGRRTPSGGSSHASGRGSYGWLWRGPESHASAAGQ